MQIISDISDCIESKLCDAECHIKKAMELKETHSALAQVFMRISTDEMNHIALLHEQVTALIAEYRKEHGDPPERMMGIYEYLHKKHIEKANNIKVMQALFK